MPATRRPRPTPGAPDASMTLINELLNRPLDPGYAAAARRRQASGQPPPRWQRSPWLTLTAVVLGVIFAVSALTLGAPPGATAHDRAALVGRIEARRAAVDAREAQVRRQQASIAALEAPTTTGAVDRNEAVAGATPVHGPGLIITVDDAPGGPAVASDGDPRTPQDAPGRIVARDLQAIANALWAAGAEGVAINGLRLTSTTSIRFAGAAILVGYRPLTRPYTVSAIAGPDAVRAFEGGEGGAYLDELRRAYQAQAKVQPDPDVHLAAGSVLNLRAARTRTAESEPLATNSSAAPTTPIPASGGTS